MNILLTVVPPILTALSAYLIARRKYAISERMNKAKLETETQNQALIIVRGVMNDMQDELRKDIDGLKEENRKLRFEIDDARQKITDLQGQLRASDELIDTMKSEVSSLKKTIELYEHEIQRLRGQNK